MLHVTMRAKMLLVDAFSALRAPLLRVAPSLLLRVGGAMIAFVFVNTFVREPFVTKPTLLVRQPRHFN